MDTKELVEEITNHVNTFGDKSEAFNEAMERQHRTLQQSFTKLALKWLEHVASDEYRFDDRNEQTHRISKQLLEGFRERQAKEGYTGTSLDMMSKPSGWLSCI